MSASQDFRDGAASGARTMLDRLTRVQRWGVRLTPDVMNAVAADIVQMMGGHDRNLDSHDMG